METIVHILILALLAFLVLAILFEATLRIKSELYNKKRKNPNQHYALAETPETIFLDRFVYLRNLMLKAFLICFVVSGVLGILLSFNQ